MRIKLNEIKRDYYDLLISNINKIKDAYLKNDELIYDLGDRKIYFDEMCEPIVEGAEYFIDIEMSDLKYDNYMKHRQNFLIAKKLHHQLSLKNNIPKNILYSEYFWTYLAHQQPFKTFICERYIKSDYEDFEDYEEDDARKKDLVSKIKRFYFFKEKISRTGIMFLWSMADKTYRPNTADPYEFTNIAFQYIDSVKAIYERNFSKNKDIILAFIEGIKINNRSSYFKDKNYRSLIPTHISNVAAINMLDAYSYKELVDFVAKEQAFIIAEAGKDRKI